jgi:23S rRNA U2552 (ribose-2'-O)-methylase RlmE/FtsJ
METAIPKPPWEGTEKQWQPRLSGVGWTASGAPAGLLATFSPWKEEPSAPLLDAKEKVAALDKQKCWELLKKMVNPYEMIFTHEDPHFHPSLSLMKPLSRSYFKMIEMLDVLDFFPRVAKTVPNVRTGHIAEGPGGFIQATLDVAERYNKRVKQATAMTLRPTDSYIPGWRRAASFLHNHKEVKLHYGADDTGNVYNPHNQDSFIEATSPGVHLFTADGGFDFSSDYAMQEQSVFRLLACSVYVGLRCLVSDGALVIKIFDSFSESTEILLACMARCFKEWMIYKPAMSRPCNSERYFLGRGFVGLNPQIRQLLEQMCGAAGADRFPVGLAFLQSEGGQVFTEYLAQQQAASVGHQLQSLSRSLYFANHISDWYTKQMPIDFQTSLQWCNRFKIPTSLKTAAAVTPPATWSCRCPAGDTSMPAADPQ